MRIFGFEINRISKKQREEEDNFKNIIKLMHDTLLEMTQIFDESNCYGDKDNHDDMEKFFLIMSDKTISLLKMIDMYTSNICQSPMISYKLDECFQQIDDGFATLITATQIYLKLYNMIATSLNEIKRLDEDVIDEDEELNDVVSEASKNLSMQKDKMIKIFSEYRCKVTRMFSLVNTEYIKVTTGYDFIKNRVKKKNAFDTRAEHNRKFFEYNIKFRSDLTSEEINNQKIKVGGKLK